MMARRPGADWSAILPWVGSALLWFGVIPSLRQDQAGRLTEQGQVRRDRVKAERMERENEVMKARIASALAAACRASADPAVLRQRAVSATEGLSLSPFALSVTGPPGAGASVDAEGARAAVLELAARLGNPARGGFLRSVTVRDLGARSSVSLTTGVLDSFAGVLPLPAPCANDPGPGAELPPVAADPVTAPKPRPAAPAVMPSRMPEVSLVLPDPSPALPFTLVGFLIAEGRTRVSIRVGNEVRVVSAGDAVSGWKCASIDRDEGAVFVSASGDRRVLKAAQ